MAVASAESLPPPLLLPVAVPPYPPRWTWRMAGAAGPLGGFCHGLWPQHAAEPRATCWEVDPRTGGTWPCWESCLSRTAHSPSPMQWWLPRLRRTPHGW